MSNKNISDFLSGIKESSISMYRYSLRRAFGIYYSIWSISIFYFVFLGPLLYDYLPSNTGGFAMGFISFMLVLLIASYYTYKVFSRSGRAMEMDRIFHMGSGKLSKKFYLLYNVAYLFILVSLILYLEVELPDLMGFIIFYLVLSLIPIYLLISMKISLGNITLDGYASAMTYMFSIISTVIFLILTRPPSFPQNSIDIFWSPTLIGWIFASMYSFYMAPGELGIHEG